MAAENNLRMDGKSLDITKENVAALKQLFPEIVEEGKIDFDKLKTILGEEIDSNDERYNFTWHGKNQAIKISQTPSMGTLRPCKEESVDWDTTQNLYIEGDNLEVLKLLQKSYFGKVKMIYIDPPYNTGNDFVYKDDFNDSIDNYKHLTKQIDDSGYSISTNTGTDGRYHTNWLNMIYPRLKVARNLLAEDGIVFISIDDNEHDNLLAVSKEIFGESCYIGSFVWKRRTSSALDKHLISIDHEYVVCFSKKIDTYFTGTEKDYKSYSNPDDDPRGPWTTGDLTVGMNGDARPNQYYDLIDPKTGKVYKPNYNRVWAYIPESMEKLVSENRVIFPEDTSKRPMQKRYASELKISTNPFSSWMDKVGLNTEGTRALAKLFDGKGFFNYTKPISLLKLLFSQVLQKDDLVMDFFSGSATTAHAIMQFNADKNYNCRYILVQLDEKTSEDSEAYRAGYHNICEIGKERIRRAGDELRKNQSQRTIGGKKSGIDVGFKVFKLDSSNIKKWNPGADVKQTLIDYQNNIVSDSGRTDLDVVYEIILKMGLDLASVIYEIDVAGVTLYSINSGALMICLDDVKDTSIAEKMISIYKEQNPAVWKVVFKDNGFASDDVKANTRETLKMAGLPEGSFVTL